jgi:LysR family transcriptional regulator, glycine cleavage system transcriptional activator
MLNSMVATKPPAHATARAHLPLQTLPAFQAVARKQSVRAAAEELHLTASAVSQQIKLLEAQLGLPLFTRRGRSLALNLAGAALLRAVEPALSGLATGVRAAQAAHAAGHGQAQTLRLTVLPSFTQRWLLPRMGRWRERHPDILLDLNASQQVLDLQREGLHAGLRSGAGPWRGLQAHALIQSPLIALATPQRAAQLGYGNHTALAQAPLLGSQQLWQKFLALCGCTLVGKTVADFNDAGLMLQAAEQDLGVTLSRELLAADALQAGRLVRVSPHALQDEAAASYWLVYPPDLAQWPPLVALRDWLLQEMAVSQAALAAQAAG